MPGQMRMPSSGVDEAEGIITCRSRLGAPTIGHPTPAEGEGALAAASPVPVGHLQLCWRAPDYCAAVL